MQSNQSTPSVPEPSPATLGTERPEGPPPKRRGYGCAPTLGCLVVVVFAGSVLLNLVLIGLLGGGDSEPRVQEKHFSHNREAKRKIAIISIEGAILDGQGFVKREIDHARRDAQVRAVVLRVNSPGGTVTGSDFLYHHLSRLAKERNIPIVVSMGGIAASGGYYVSMAAGSGPDAIFAEPTTWTGSIGVVIPHYEAVELLQKWGIQSDSVVSHRLKGMGSLSRHMTEEERKIFQALVDESFAQFKATVKQGRPKFQKDPAALDKLATGQVYSAPQALQNGLVDRIGFVEDAVEQAIQLAGLTPDEVHVVQYKPEFSWMEFLLGTQAKSPGWELEALLELTVPRAYYLCSWMPPLVSGQ